MSLNDFGTPPQTTNGFRLLNVGLSSSDDIEAFSWNSFGLGETGSNQVRVDDIAFPIAVPRTLNVSRDSNGLPFFFSGNVSFLRADLSDESPGDSRDILGYRLHLKNLATTTSLLIGELLLVDLGLAPTGTFVVSGLQVETLGNFFEIRSFHEDLESQSFVSATFSDLASPVAVAFNITHSQDENLELNQVSYFVRFSRARSTDEAPSNATAILGYSLFLIGAGSETKIADLLIENISSHVGGNGFCSPAPSSHISSRIST